MAVHLHRAHRTDVLADELARLLAQPQADPFAQEVVVVPARGVERWLTQRLSHRLGTSGGRDDGVCAGVRFHTPHSLTALLAGTERTDPWNPDRLAWPLLASIDECLGQPWARTLATHLGDGDDPIRRGRRYSLARRLAGLFAGYATQRPVMLANWRAGTDDDGWGQPIDSDLRWQPELYRHLVARMDTPAPDQRHAQVVAQIRDGQPLALPDRLSLFGHTRLPVTDVDLLAAVGTVREVHLWLPQVSARLWHDLREVVADGPVLRATDNSGRAVGHPLLASLGRDARELQRTLVGLEPDTDTVVDERDGPTSTDGATGDSGPLSLLQYLQADLRANAEPGPSTRASRQLAPEEGSIQVHACHGPSRQIEVLRDALLGLLQDDPTLAPRDILVMCPDIDSYAPLFEAAFGLADLGTDPDGGTNPGHGLRLRLADRGAGQTNPILDVAARLVAIAGGRAAATDILDLASSEVVSRRFRFSEDDLAQLSQWVQHSYIRWGLAADLRAPYALQLPHNTWQLGLDRLLLGVAMSEDGQRRFAHTLPLDDVPSAAVDLAGRFSELVQRVETSVRALLSAGPASEWIAALTAAIDALAEPDVKNAWQRTQAHRELAQIADAARVDVPLRLADIRTLLEQRLEGRAGRANFRTGALTVATMIPMRSVPHRVIAMVGLDDGTFPRVSADDGDDALARRPVTGDRDVRAQDRQLLLDAVLAATDQLVITYTGSDEIRGETRPPSVPLGELLDTLDLTTATQVRDRVLVHHPLQPFDVRNFRPGALQRTAPAQPFSFDTAALAGAIATQGTRVMPEPFLSAPLPPLPPGDVTLADLHAMVSHPVRAFVRGRLQVSLPWDDDEPDDAIPVELSGLSKWAIGDRMLRQVLAGQSVADAEAAERSRGGVPPLALGDAILTQVREQVEPLVAAAAPAMVATAQTLDIVLDLAGRRITGQVPDVRGESIVRVSYSRLGAKARLAAWVDLVMLRAARPEIAWSARIIGRGGGRQATQQSSLGPVDPEKASAIAAELLDFYDRGMCEPLPVPLKTASIWAQTPGTDDNRAYAADKDWRSGRFEGECDDRYHQLVWGPDMPLRPDTSQPAGLQRGLLAEYPREGELWNSQATRLGQFALRLWSPLLEHEQMGPA
ncbi:MAG: exodeoxyribonuclease V subunit gamma [Beutenbergiaceae bacterium]